jgi:hypothetical protein
LCLLGAVIAHAQQPSSSTTNIFIQILPRGMDPQQVTVPHGEVTILVQNRSTAPNVTMDLNQMVAN